MKTLNFISGLPRSGSSLISSILKQNDTVHSQTVGHLSSLISAVNSNWNNLQSNEAYGVHHNKSEVLSSIVDGYYKSVDKDIVFDRSLNWVPLIGTIESVLQKQVKILVCVRNPAEILSSYERLYRENPLSFTHLEQTIKGGSSIASRAYHYAGPDGVLGKTHRDIKDAIVMGYLDRMLFVDYGLFCGSPKSQTKRIYDFFEIPNFEHNYKNIPQDEFLPSYLRVKPELRKTTVNCVQYLGLELYEQYNREIFWNAFV
jgi:sulfotransferase